MSIALATWTAAIVMLLTPAVLRAELLVISFNTDRVFRYHETIGAFIDTFIANAGRELSQPHGFSNP